MPPPAVDRAPGQPAFVVFSDDWGEHPSSCQHLFRNLSCGSQVLWINTIGMRNPRLTWSDLRKVSIKVGKMLGRTRAGARSESAPAQAVVPVHVRQPFMLPFNSFPPIRAFNRRSVVAAVRRALAELQFAQPVIVSTVPNAADFVGSLGGRRIVYYCVDDFSQWPGLDRELVRGMERDLIARSDVLVATSQNLLQRLSATGKPTLLLSHGVDLTLFGSEAPAEHPCLRHIGAPRAGYFGLFDERSDQALIAALAERMPDFSFVFTGPVATDVTRLTALTNVHFTGPLPYEELPALVKGLDALFIPYAVNDFTATISPLKLKEYLATGKPVVTTPLAEALLQREYLTVAHSPAQWEAALRSALDSDLPSRRRSMQRVLAGESWAGKARRFLEICLGADGAAVP